jgi:hypothetical protein
MNGIILPEDNVNNPMGYTQSLDASLTDCYDITAPVDSGKVPPENQKHSLKINNLFVENKIKSIFNSSQRNKILEEKRSDYNERFVGPTLAGKGWIWNVK